MLIDIVLPYFLLKLCIKKVRDFYHTSLAFNNYYPDILNASYKKNKYKNILRQLSEKKLKYHKKVVD